ncbi:MAG TPA: aminotransferase class I/II-fold pyridoxal phosphate-dependent enzyme [Desulfobacteria bacterium]|nr:aminotransferase class I/II-fold pyridoxal phosphate-dependent enzyme [Desulfobacteria bacterium]
MRGKTPLLDAIIKYLRLSHVPLHMPGHKLGHGLSRKFKNIMTKTPFSLDLTEIPGLDDLHNPTGPILEAQARAAALFGAEHTFFLVNGTTSGLHAAIMGLCSPGDELLLPRDVHRSVIGACILAGVRPKYIGVRFDKEYCIPYPVTANDVSEAMQNNPMVRAVLQVYPSYYGLAGELTSITKISHQYDIPVIVDEAHGAHFVFSNMLPPTALESGADISVQSTHKTLGAFTQASMLHINSRLIDKECIARQLKMIQTTSPSYLLMSSLDAAVGHMEVAGQRLWEQTVTIVEKLRKNINQIPGIKCLGNSIIGKNGVKAIDPTKLYLSFRETGLSGYRAAEILSKKFGIQVELSDSFSVLCMFSIGNTANDAKQLLKALREISLNRRPLRRTVTIAELLPLPPVIMTPREAWFAPKSALQLDGAVGKICGEMIAPYPPGIPIVCPGEEITREVIEVIKEFKANSHSFHGSADPEMNFVTVVNI